MEKIGIEMLLEHKMSPTEYVKWVQDVFDKHFDAAIIPTKIRIPFRGTDYFNVMPCVMDNIGYLGVKTVTRSSYRQEHGFPTIGADILLYDSHTLNLLALMDGSYITTVRTAAVAAHSIMNCSLQTDVIGLIGLGKIGNCLGEILFEKLKNRQVTVRLYNYKDHADKFVDRFQTYDNVHFEICNSYDEIVEDADVVVSCVSYTENDFCSSDKFKYGCTVVPVHLRGFMECDKEFEHVITSDLVSIRKFSNYSKMKKISLINDVIAGKATARDSKNDRVIVYNCGLAIYDLYFAIKFYESINQHV